MTNIEKLLQKFVEYLENTETFVAEQAPDFIQQMIAYYTWEAWFDFLLWLLLPLFPLIIFLLMFALLCIEVVKRESDPLFFKNGVAVATFFLATTLLCSIPSCNAYKDLKKLEIAPKVYLLEKARELVK